MRPFSLILGVIILLVSFLTIGSPFHFFNLLGFIIGAIFVLMGLFMPSWQLVRERRQARMAAKSTAANTPDAILNERYAKGEITKEQYDSMKKDIDAKQ